MQSKASFVLSLAVALFAFAAAAGAADSKTVTTIDVKGMHCPSCAKKIVTGLQKIAGVQAAQTDVEQGTLSVTPKDKQAPSPRALWEAVEQAGYTPTKLQGPSGIFTSKPKS
jgi:Cu+-exporting ATPase